MDPREHDEALALTSHLPHLIAAVLASTLPAEYAEVAASGFRDTTRLAAGDPELWAAIFTQNQNPLRRAVGVFRDRLVDFSAALHAGDAAELGRLLAEAKKIRDALDGS
jgi:prephenate dehydrogenase